MGDYSILGFEDRWCVERKMISDLVGFVGREREKTVKKLVRMREIITRGGWCGLAIEAKEGELYVPRQTDAIHPEVMRAFLLSVNIRYGIHTYIHHDREWVARWVLDRAVKFYNILRET